MAEENTRFLDSLREANLLLLSRLHASQKAIWKDVKVFKSNTEPSGGNNDRNYGLERVQFTGYGPNRVPVSLRSGEQVSKRSQKSPVKGYESTDNGFSTTRERREKENTPGNSAKMGLNSILRTPQSRRKKQILNSRHCVTFNQSTPAPDLAAKNDRPLLGYDWIAGMLDNDSYLSEKDDGFFEDLKEFRRVNKNECSGLTVLQPPSKSPILPNKPPEEEDENYHRCAHTYVLDDRLFAVPIHGSESYCAVCKTRKPSEYETEGSYVRISVPRSTLQSPHRVKPHRRKSFDPTDTVSLSKHCLLGWESSRPAVIPTQSSLDLRAHTGISKLNALNWSHASGKSNAKGLCNRTHSLQPERQQAH